MAQYFQVIWRRHREHLKPPPLGLYPATPPVLDGYYPGSKAPITYKVNFTTKLQTLPQLTTYPFIPVVNYYPAFVPLKTNKVEYTTRFQAIPQLASYPETPSIADITSWLTHFEKTSNSTNRKYLTLQQLNTYPETPLPAVAITAWIPHFESTKNYTNYRFLPVQELNTYPAPPVFTENNTSWFTHFELTRNLTNRRLLGIELNTYPAISAPATYSISSEFQIVRVKRRKHITPEELNVYPLPPVYYIDGKTSFTIAENYGSVILYPKDADYFTFEETPAGLDGEIQFKGEDDRFNASEDLTWDNSTKILDIVGIVDIAGQPTIYNAGALDSNFIDSIFIGNGGQNQVYAAGWDGRYNTGIGVGALEANIGGHSNNAQGWGALKSNTQGDYNSAQGMGALNLNTTGSNNSAQGRNGLTANTTGNYNTATGSQAGFFNRIGHYNLFLGGRAGYGVLNGSDITGNIFIGYEAGFAVLTGADYNITIGHQAGDNITTGSRNIIIGKNIDAPSATSDDQLNIGNTLYGDLANKRVGIEVEVPLAQLHTTKGRIVGTLRTTDPLTLTSDHYDVKCNTDAGDVPITLPAGVSGTMYRIGNSGTSGNKVTITPDGSEALIGANSNFTLYDGETLVVIYESTEGWT